MKLHSLPVTLLSILCLPLLAGAVSCQSTYYKTMAAFGKQKRHILVDNVQDAREEQEAAKEDFQDALKAFMQVTRYDGSALEGKYNKLSSELASCESRAKSVSSEIESVEEVANDLFEEWEAELKDYSSSELKTASETKLRESKRRYGDMMTVMKRAEATMGPVLTSFRDQVMFLKHNLNAQALASLRGNVATLEENVAKLVKDMEASISEATAFLKAMEQEQQGT